MIEQGRERLASVPFHRYFPKRTYGIVRRRGKEPGPIAREFIELVRDWVRKGRNDKSKIAGRRENEVG